MKIKLEHKIFFWLVLLMFTSGYLNSSSIILYSYSISHHTGNLTQIAISFYKDIPLQTVSLIGVVAAFFLGGVLSGFLFYEYDAGFSKKFGTLLIIDGILLFIIHYFIEDIFIRYTTISFIMGNQNAFLVRYEGITTRSSHITGYLTDAAVCLGRMMRGKKSDVRPFLVLIFKILGFMIGAAIGCYLTQIDARLHLVLPAVIYILAGFFYYTHIYEKDAEEKALVNE